MNYQTVSFVLAVAMAIQVRICMYHNELIDVVFAATFGVIGLFIFLVGRYYR